MRLAFVDECGPDAIAAALGIPPQEAARLLWPVRAFWWDHEFGPVGSRSSSDRSFGTPELAFRDVLIRHGWGLDVYSGDGRLLADPEMVAELLRSSAQRRALDVRPLGRRTRKPSLALEKMREARGELANLRTLEEWRDLNRAGWWFYHLNDGHSGHVVCYWGTKLLSGGPEAYYLDWRATSALRLHPPHKETERTP